MRSRLGGKNIQKDARELRVLLGQGPLSLAAAGAGYAHFIIVAQWGGDYTSIQDAIDSVSDASATNRYLIWIMPGLYTEQITMQSWVDLRGVSKHTCQVTFTGNDNGTIILADSVQIEDILIEETDTATEWAIVGTNTSNIHIRNVDILGSGANVSQGIKITGDSWKTLFIEHSVINYLGTTGWGIYLTGNAVTPHETDTSIVDCFVDSFNATTGGSIYIGDQYMPIIRECICRTEYIGPTGYSLYVNNTSGAGDVRVLVLGSALEYGNASLFVDAGAVARLNYSVVHAITNNGTVLSWGCGLGRHTASPGLFVQGSSAFLTINATGNTDATLNFQDAGNTDAVIWHDQNTSNFVIENNTASGQIVLNTNGGNIIFYDDAATATKATLTPGPILFVNDTANANQTIGATLNQGANDDTILALKSSDVAHGITTIQETDTYGYFKKESATQGGLQVVGINEATLALTLHGYGVSDNTTKSTAGVGYIALNAAKKSGTTLGDPGANANILSVASNGTTRILVTTEGHVYVLTGDMAVNRTSIAAQLDVYQDSATGAQPVLKLEQKDVSEEFTRFVGTAAAATLTQSIVNNADVTTATLAGWLKVYVVDDGNQITDQAYYQPIYTLA